MLNIWQWDQGAEGTAGKEVVTVQTVKIISQRQYFVSVMFLFYIVYAFRFLYLHVSDTKRTVLSRLLL